MQKKEYGLFTAIALIVGTVIGSGIFFKSDNILVYTNGSVSKGVFVFIIAAIGIIFGSLSISVLASRTNNPGGLITYADEFVNKKTACAFGWFQTFIYYPAIIAVIGWVAAIYICMFLGIEDNNTNILLISSLAIIIIYIINVFCTNLGGYFQNAATIIKLIPLVIIAITGILVGDASKVVFETASVKTSSISWLAAIAPIAFSYDGWVVSTSVAHEIKNSEKNLPIALIFGSIFILIAYIIYFVGICNIVSPENIVAQGDAHVNIVAREIFGIYGAKIIVGFVVISVLGTLNGFTLGFIRLPYSLGIRGMFPNSKKYTIIDDKFKMPINSAKISFLLTIVWIIINYIVQSKGLMPNSDVSEIPIVASYILYILLYISVIKLYIKEKSKNNGISLLMGVIVPIIAILGSLIVIIGGLANPINFVYIGICFIVIIFSVIFMNLKQN